MRKTMQGPDTNSKKIEISKSDITYVEGGHSSCRVTSAQLEFAAVRSEQVLGLGSKPTSCSEYTDEVTSIRARINSGKRSAFKSLKAPTTGFKSNDPQLNPDYKASTSLYTLLSSLGYYIVDPATYKFGGLPDAWSSTICTSPLPSTLTLLAV